MIPSGVEIFVALTPIDLRWGFDRLAGFVEEQVGRPARSGALFVFFGRRKSALKILFFDGSGMCQFYKRLDSHAAATPVCEADTHQDDAELRRHARDVAPRMLDPLDF